jgi:RHS repeat-associated protein
MGGFMRASILAAAVFCIAASTAGAQTGNPPFATFGGGAVDSINMSVLNTHVDIPVFAKAGRGLPFRYAISFDNSIWSPIRDINGVRHWEPLPNFGWRGFTEAIIGYVSYTATATTCLASSTPTTKYTGFTYHDPAGGSHFGGNMVDSAGCFGGPHDFEHVLDGSGYSIDVTLSGSTLSVIVYSPSGSIIIAPLQNLDPSVLAPASTPIGNGTITDSNGNQSTASVSGSIVTFTDTLGIVVMTVDSSNPSAVKYTYTGPDGKPASVVVNYTQYTVTTNFGISGIAEYPATPALLPSSIVFPDTSSYQFMYETTPGFAPDVTGRLASITLPTGGQISYVYTGGSNGIDANGVTTGITRNLGTSQWTYVRNAPATGPSTTTVTDPNGNQTVFNFSGIHELQRQMYQGSVLSGTLLETQLTCYNGNTTNCATASVSGAITSIDVYDQLPGGLQSRTRTNYDALGNQTETDQFDYGTGVPGPLLRKITTTYASLGNNITGKPAAVTVTDGAGRVASQALFGYDETGLTATSEPQHIAVTGSRGNVTSISQLTAPNIYLTKKFTYYDTGAINTYTDVNGAVITYNYGTGSCNNSYPTSVSLPLGLSLSTTWDCTGGVNTSSTDENQKTTNFTYNTAADPSIWRVKQTTDPLGNVQNTIYGISTNESVLNFNSGLSSVDVLATFDSYGRPSTAQIRNAPGGTSFDTIETDYDALGRSSRTTSLYAGTAGQTNPTMAAATTTYDAMNRVLRQNEASGSFVIYSYNGTNDILAQKGPAPTGENLKQKQFEYDALGRLTSVCDITSLAGSGPCGQNTAATGYLTRYTYDTLNNILTVTQNAQSAAPQVRSFTYDFVSRKTLETTPESGTINYIYDSDPSGACPTSNPGDLVRRVDAAGVSTCYAYDARRRMTSAVSNGLGAVSIAGSEQSKVVSTPGTGSVTIGGAEQSKQVLTQAATSAAANITINGGEQSFTDTSNCNLINHIWVCHIIYDRGSVTITVNGVPASCSYSQTLNTTSSQMASCLASALTNATNSQVTATASGSTITMTSRAVGASSNYGFSFSTSWDSADFSSPSYSASPASGNLAGGADPVYTTVYDSGTVMVTIASFTASAPYGQSGNNTAALVATALVNDPNTGLNTPSSPVTATVNNNVISLTAKDSATYSLSATSSSSAGFSPPSFSASPSVSSLTGSTQTLYDTGAVSITVGSSTASMTYGQNDTVVSIANNLVSAINATSTYPATASLLYPSRIELVAKQPGSYSVSASSSTTNSNFNSPSFNVQTASTAGIDSSRQTRFVYDTATVNGQAMVNTKGRLAEAMTCISDCTGSHILTDLGFSYDPVGNLSDTYESTPHSGGYYHLTATYWSHDRLHTLGGLPGLPTFTFQPDSEGRISTISASTGQNPVTSTTFNTASQVTAVTFGSGDSDVYTIDSSTGRMTQFKATVGANGLTGTMTWNTNGSLAGLSISDQFNPAANQNCTYAYDDLARLASANCGGTVWAQTFSYDPFGNIAMSGSGTFQPLYSGATNRIQSVGGFTPTYTPNGGLLNDGAHNYTWDSEGNISSVDSVGLVYDAMGRMVEQARGSSYTQIVYSPTGDKLALMNGQTLQKAFLNLPGGGTAVYNSSGLAYYRHPDWLGSSRLASTPGQTIFSDSSYSPFGQSYAQSGTADLSFTGKNQDTVGGLYDFLYREYSPLQGRWISCDPIGSGSADPADPQTWNKYIYALNNPVGLIDPDGLQDKPPCKDLIIMGIKATPSADKKTNNDGSAEVEKLASEYGYNVAFPYAGKGAVSSIVDVFRQGQGATTAATKTAMDALQYTINQGGTTVINFSGGAQAYASAMAAFNGNGATAGASSKIQDVVYLSPGTGGSRLVSGATATDRYRATGFVDALVNFTAPAEAGQVERGKLKPCGHNAACELKKFLEKCGDACKNDPCTSKIFKRGGGSRENSGGPPPPPNPFPTLEEKCTWTGEDWQCIWIINLPFPEGSWENPGGQGTPAHPPFW